MIRKVKITDVITTLGEVMPVIGDRETVRKHVIECHDEFITLECMSSKYEPKTFDLLNVPRTIGIVGDEREIEIPDAGEATPSFLDRKNGGTGHVSL